MHGRLYGNVTMNDRITLNDWDLEVSAATVFLPGSHLFEVHDQKLQRTAYTSLVRRRLYGYNTLPVMGL